MATTRTLPFSAETQSGNQFDHLKRRLARDGIFRYDDMFAIAERHLTRNPTLAQATAMRFPFVLLDEMQDTSAMQQRLLDKVFAAGHTVVQRVGDVNQRIFEDRGDAQIGASAFPLPMSAELPVSRRFGTKIASLASDLTVHRSQRIEGTGPEGTIALLLFDRDSVDQVVPTFERLARSLVPRHLLLENPPRVLGARRHPGSSPKFPQSLACYVPGLTLPGRGETRGLLIAAARTAQEQRRHGDTHAAVQQFWNTLRGAVRPCAPEGLPPLSRLDRDPTTVGGRIRALLNSLLTDALDDEEGWQRLTRQLIEALPELTQSSWEDPTALQEPMAYFPAEAPATRHLINESGIVTSVAGTIQSAKGETHAATLVLECLDRTGKKHDVAEVLGLLAGASDIARASPTIRRAAQLIFVGATRPTRLLALAALRERAAPHTEALARRGWAIHDVRDPWLPT
ncbi:hypothetical protein GCM10010103_78930 [Streptomyces paradoxus]|uniref:UvrD-like helicase ATP-binding domain-containing protein n=1 Tax=Streptomyces paradoxus TaxID=66375 RepID=A0A7W9WLP5_9ACTN|nr:UvrD-helicase domain-containing protein [Streptomyces paradoxus]MBB6081951.1 hypothetical protein [Streptomyces paradoxus]